MSVGVAVALLLSVPNKLWSRELSLTEADWSRLHFEVQYRLALRLEEEGSVEAPRAWELAFAEWQRAVLFAEAERQAREVAASITLIGGRLLCTEDLWAAMDKDGTTLV